MGMQWIDSIKSSGQLTYYLNSITGLWLTAIQEAVREFNNLSSQHNLGVKFVQTNDAPTDTGGANVAIATGNGTVSYNFLGSRQTNVRGSGLHGSTLLINRPNSLLEKAFVFLPAQPIINTPRGQRPTGAGVMKVIALHELIHATGLHNSDHTNEDVFNGHPTTDPGRNAAADRIQITVNRGYRFMPPIIFSSITARKVRNLW